MYLLSIEHLLVGVFGVFSSRLEVLIRLADAELIYS